MSFDRYMKAWVAGIAMSAVCALPVFGLMDLDKVLGMWLLDEEDGEKAADSSGHGNDGSHAGGAEIIDGKFGKGLELFGDGEGVVIPGLAGIFPPRNFTVTMWLRMSDWQDEQIYAMAAAGGDQFTTSIVANEKLLHFHAGDIFLFCLIPTDEPNWVDNWVHFAFVKNYVDEAADRYYALYINGVEWKRCRRVGTPLNAAEGDFTFGGVVNTFDGAIDDLGIFTEALTEAEIKNIADNGLDFAVLAVNPKGKATSTWAALKAK